MKFTLTVLFALLCLSSFAQSKNKKAINKETVNSYKDLMPVTYIINFEAKLTQIQGKFLPEETPIKQIISALSDSITLDLYKQSAVYAKKYQKLILEYFNNIQSFGKVEKVLAKGRGAPFDFVIYKDNLTFIQKSIFSNFDLNTLKLDADQRATYIIKNIILPSLNNFAPLTMVSEIKYFALDVGYRVRDFSDTISPDIGEGEQTSIVISKEVLLKYIKAEISDQEAIKSSVFYNFNIINKNIRLLSF